MLLSLQMSHQIVHAGKGLAAESTSNEIERNWLVIARD